MSPKRLAKRRDIFEVPDDSPPIPKRQKTKYGNPVQRTLHATLNLHEKSRRNETAEKEDDAVHADISEVPVTTSPKTRTRKGRTPTQALNAVLRQTKIPENRCDVEDATPEADAEDASLREQDWTRLQTIPEEKIQCEETTALNNPAASETEEIEEIESRDVIRETDAERTEEDTVGAENTMSRPVFEYGREAANDMAEGNTTSAVAEEPSVGCIATPNDHFSNDKDLEDHE